MRRKRFFIGSLVVAFAVVLTVGIAVASSQSGGDLPALTPAELLVKVAEEAPNTTTVSGDIAWNNDLLGVGAVQLPGDQGALFSLLLAGSGRFWHQDGMVRFESQGRNGDMIVVANGETVWVYSSQSATATEYTLPAKPADASDAETSTTTGATSTTDATSAADAAGAVDLPRKIQEMVEGLAPYADLTVTTGVVAGRDSYVLVMTPTAENTVVGSLQATFDGETFLPLRVQVFAAEDPKPVIDAGFTTISYDQVAAGSFEFTPPADATVELTILSMPAGMMNGMMGMMDGTMGTFGHRDGDGSPADRMEKEEPLTLEEAAAKAGFALVTPTDPALPFEGAYVMTPPADFALADMMRGTHGDAAGGVGDGTADAALPPTAPLVALKYGEGFGTVMMIETQVADTQWTELTTALAEVPLFGTSSPFGGRQVYQLSTRLGSIVVWRQGDTVVLVGGSVSRADLEAFVAGVR
ncbi:MAG: hypothetical protein KKA32_02570 [Actinobacteria bacterium]|nr:hypothetical protein [Actinomycetota bacterium]